MKTTRVKLEYAIIDGVIVNQNCDEVCKIGRRVITLEMPSFVDIENAMKKIIPGCSMHDPVGRAHLPETIKIPGIGKRHVECDEYPIDGDYENGWETTVTIY